MKLWKRLNSVEKQEEGEKDETKEDDKEEEKADEKAEVKQEHVEQPENTGLFESKFS